jgi:hypothetical protein
VNTAHGLLPIPFDKIMSLEGRGNIHSFYPCTISRPNAFSLLLNNNETNKIGNNLA